MVKSDMPNMPNIPGMGSMADSLEFVKKLWGGMGIPGMNQQGMAGAAMPMSGMSMPGMVMPTLSVEEINKKITDLKAVESWLTLNMNMLRGTIQALEVQAATITALHSMGETFNATMKAAGMGDPMGAGGSAYGASAARSGSASGSVPKRPSAANGGAEPAEIAQAPQPTMRDEQDAANLTAPLVNAAAWWNMLQDQFQHAVSNAMVAEPAPPAREEPAKAKPKSKSGGGTAARKTRSAPKE